jgi:sigma-B regulation protein RsbU (phosphoserine phosphatase)
VIGQNGVRRLETGGPIVGLFEAAPFEEETIVLDKGEYLVVFSDGISEATNVGGEEFGEGRIIDAIRQVLGREPQAVLDHLFKTVRDFSKGAPQGDDITGMVVTYST